ncbi:MAG TPA: rhodanese-like domain-containing protein [Legionella sp.]|nr:rhodanese-like domain-containing protein [Legionella sp.]
MEHLGQFIMNHWLLWLALIAVLLLTFINELMSQKNKAKELTPHAAVDLINNENAVVIDTRDKESFKNGHIIDAINVKAEDFDDKKMNKYKNKPVILVCARGLQSPALAAKIQAQGYQPMVLKGGLAAWQNADLPIVKKG